MEINKISEENRKKHASLFSGIGGFDIAAEWAGFENVFSVEIDDFCDKVLKKNFPNVRRYNDIKKFTGKKYRGAIDVLSGGFPCQPFSVAGKRKGKEDDRYLWEEMVKVIRNIQPTWIIGENVAGIISMGIEQVLSDLENEGYQCQAFLIPACAKNAPHRRDRVWIIGYLSTSNSSNTKSKRNRNGMFSISRSKQNCKRWKRMGSKHCNNCQNAANSEHNRCERQKISNEQRQENSLLTGTNSNAANTNDIGIRPFTRQREREFTRDSWERNWIEVATELCGVDDGLPAELDEFKLTKSKHRNERLKALGNAIVPQVAYEIFKAIKEIENEQIKKENL